MQHHNIYPRKDKEKIPDSRIFDLFKKQVKIDCLYLRTVLIGGNAYIIFSDLIGRAQNQLLIEALECIIISFILIFLQLYLQKNWEDHRLPFKMKDNKSNYLFKKKRGPN
jgi:hypothetical protein